MFAKSGIGAILVSSGYWYIIDILKFMIAPKYAIFRHLNKNNMLGYTKRIEGMLQNGIWLMRIDSRCGNVSMPESSLYKE